LPRIEALLLMRGRSTFDVKTGIELKLPLNLTKPQAISPDDTLYYRSLADLTKDYSSDILPP